MWSFKVKAALGIAGITLLAAAAWSVYNAGFRAGESKIQAKWDAEVSAMALAQAAELERAMARTAELQARVEQIRRSHRNEVNRIRREHTALVDSLRERPEARADTGGVPPGADVGVGCTGAGLARGDADFLVRYAADAARLQTALHLCKAEYEAVRDALTRAGAP